MDNNGNVNQPGCCDDGQCCSPIPTEEDRKSRRWKTLIFAAVILLAGGVAAYSLFWRTPATPAACCPPGSAAAAACGQAATNPSFDHTAAPVGLSLVVLTNTGKALSSEKLTMIGEVRASLESHDAQLQFETLESGDTAFLKLANQYGITAFPAMIVTGQDKVLVLSESQVNADTILSVFKPKPASAAPDSASKSGSL